MCKVVFFILLISSCVFAQSGKSIPKTPVVEVPAKNLYEEAETYKKRKFQEFTDKKIPYNKSLVQQISAEQKVLAAKYVLQVSARKTLNTDDLYYLGMLHYLAENTSGAQQNLQKYLIEPNAEIDKLQTSRVIVAVYSARKKQFENAEKVFVDYKNNQPQNLQDSTKIASELAENYKLENRFSNAKPHAEIAFQNYQKLALDNTVNRSQILNDIYDSGERLFEINRELGDYKSAQIALEEIQKTSITMQAIGIYFYATDRLITFLAESNQKKEALSSLAKTYETLPKNFPIVTMQNEIIRGLKIREKHYQLIGEIAPELKVDEWIGDAKTLANLRGKVVLLDFWATWCGPCKVVFPHLTEWNELYKKDGFETIGVTRFYYRPPNVQPKVKGGKITDADIERAEIEYLKVFKKKFNLNYDFSVTRGDKNQRNYDATNLPTAVLLDRKGVVRFIRIGVGDEENLEKEIKRLLAEK